MSILVSLGSGYSTRSGWLIAIPATVVAAPDDAPGVSARATCARPARALLLLLLLLLLPLLARAAAAGCSRRTSRAGLSCRSPWNDGCLIFPSLVHSVKTTSQTSAGLTQCAFRASAPVGGGVNRLDVVCSRSSVARNAIADFCEKPVPTLPQKMSRSRS